VAAVLCLLAVAELGWMHGAGRRSAGLYCRDTIAGLMTPSQIEEAQRLAREWSAAHPQDQEHAYFAYHLQGTRNNRSLVVGQRCGQSQSLGKTAIARWEHEQRSAA
jgi:hypothetical protein